jgi:hypothetical protein
MKKLTVDINLNDEVAYLAEFIRLKWTPIKNLEALFGEIRDAAFHAGRAHFDSHVTCLKAREMEKARTALLATTYGRNASAELYDALCTLLFEVGLSVRGLSDAGLDLDGEWDFTRLVAALELQLAPRYPDLANARPQGWLDQAAADALDEYDPYPDRELFKGARVDGPISSDFPGRVALPYVMYAEVEQDYRASHSLVGAVFAHFLGIASYLNSHKLADDLEAALPKLLEPTMLFERDIRTDNPILKVAISIAKPPKTKESFEANLASQATFEALPEEEKARRKAENAKEIQNFLDTLTLTQEVDASHEAESARHLALLRDAFKQDN